MVFVSVVSPTTTVCGSFVGAVGGGGGGATSSVVLQSIVKCSRRVTLSSPSIPGLSSSMVKTHSGPEVAVQVYTEPGTLYRYGRRNQIE